MDEKRKIIEILIFTLLMVALFAVIFGRKPIKNEDKIETSALDNFPNSEILVATGKTKEVPNYINKSVEQIESDYLTECSKLVDLNKKSKCFEEYYFGKYPKLRDSKSNCREDQVCQDNFYLDLASMNSVFCDFIKNTNIQQLCRPA